ncbi:DUF4167 domain-containing protein [Paracoccaceae bacterium]|nr:DUF4167 domain-containing protein [Paracoccaceae bacterium]
MRSPKSRSRSKQNRNNNRSVGNVLNRVFDSSGPEGKVRGTPQQIIEKYNQLARDAQLSNDRVATENFQQHAEHYLRLLARAQKEQEARREQQEKENRGRNGDREKNRVENGSDTFAGNVSDLEKDIDATSAANEGKGYNQATQEANQSDKDSSISNDEDRYSKGNRRKRNNNIQPGAIDLDEDKSSEKTSKEAAE